MEKNLMEPKIIKFMPYVGQSREDAVEGRKTKISIYDNRLEYDVCYKQKVQISMTNQLGDEEVKDSIRYVEESGVKEKNSITDIVKYVKTEYSSDGEPYKIFLLDICNTASLQTFEIEKEEDRDKVYTEVYNWRFEK